MRRDPSIHITLSKFKELLEYLEIPYFPTETFFNLARKNSIDSRAIEISNNKIKKEVSQITLASKGDTSLCAEILYATRIKLKHRGVRKITEADPKNWNQCKRLADICNTFCEDFNFLNARQGFIKYMEYGFKKMSNTRNALQKLIQMSDSITEDYGAWMEIEEYTQDYSIKQEVVAIHNEYVKTIARTTGIYEDFRNNPNKYVHFCRLHRLLKDNGWEYPVYIKAQFEALSFCNGIPSLDMMYGEKALERFNKYIYRCNHQDKEPNTPVVEGSLWSKISQS
jgi:hypothetical protein